MKVALVDLPQLIKQPSKVEIPKLFEKLRDEYDLVMAFMKAARSDDQKGCGVQHYLAKNGVLPTLCPCDPDPIIAHYINKFAQLPAVDEIALLSGDTGFALALEEAKRLGKKVTVILPDDCTSELLKNVADEVVRLSEYVKPSIEAHDFVEAIKAIT
jgi:uncharacterized protein (TIGR00288 family)